MEDAKAYVRRAQGRAEGMRVWVCDLRSTALQVAVMVATQAGLALGSIYPPWLNPVSKIPKSLLVVRFRSSGHNCEYQDSQTVLCTLHAAVIVQGTEHSCCRATQKKLQALTADNVAHEESEDEVAAHNDDDDEEEDEE